MSEPDAISRPDSPPASPWRAFAVCVSVAALTILDLSKVNVGLPSIEKALDAGPTSLQLIVAGYALAFGLVLVPSGRLGDIKSRRTMFLVGLTLFALASLACALVPSIELLVVARIIQGVAAGIQMPQVLGLVQQLFVGPDRGRAFGLFGAIIGLSTALGPTLGGLLILVGGDENGWRLLFWMNVPLAAILFVLAWRLLPRRQRSASPAASTLDPIGVVLLGVSVLALMLPFVLTTGKDDPPARWLLLIVFVLAFTGFVLWERHYRAAGKTPVIDFGLFRRASFRNGTLIATAYFAAMPATFLTVTLFLQQGLELKPVFAGMITIPFAIASAFSAWISGRLVGRIGRPLVLGGLVIVVIGFLAQITLAVVLPPELAPYGMAAALFVAGIGGGAVISPNQTLTLAEVPVAEGGVAGSIGQLGQRVGTAIGLAAGTAVFYAIIAGESGARIEVYHDAYRSVGVVTIGFVVLALIFAIADQISRSRGRARADSGSTGSTREDSRAGAATTSPLREPEEE
ncbi:MFS transporter [Schumannella luteola]|uniref:MFS family permease n=1 Tax=Schumannella luteola TaxID=472059 RepID=A0A852YQT3_9MICO|nr:MFS transporter [Schumannella luteola]NYG99595.1 MFS family permease [Schumannella luteola]TPX01998.1 MFS transporter [Schumannella luteola]